MEGWKISVSLSEIIANGSQMKLKEKNNKINETENINTKDSKSQKLNVWKGE